MSDKSAEVVLQHILNVRPLGVVAATVDDRYDPALGKETIPTVMVIFLHATENPLDFHPLWVVPVNDWYEIYTVDNVLLFSWDGTQPHLAAGIYGAFM